MKIGKVKKGNYEYYRIQVTDSQGKRKEFLAKTKKEVKVKYEDYIKNDITNINISSKTFQEFVEYYLFDIVLPSKSIKDSSFTHYEKLYRVHIKNSIIANIKIVDLKKEQLQRYFNEKQKENLKISSIKAIKTFVSIVLNYAENEDIIKKNYTKGVKLRKEISKPKDKFLTDDEINRLLNSLEDNKQLLIIVKIALATGMRINEILALTEDDFNLDECYININKTLSKHRHFESSNKFRLTVKTTSPKTSNSIRVVYFPQSLKSDLSEFIKNIKQKYLKNGVRYNNKKSLFIGNAFNSVSFNLLNYYMKCYYKKCGINQSGFHVLRHTYISKLYQAGVSQKIIQEQVGHNNISMTMHYTHIEKEQQSKAVQVLNDYFT